MEIPSDNLNAANHAVSLKSKQKHIKCVHNFDQDKRTAERAVAENMADM